MKFRVIAMASIFLCGSSCSTLRKLSHVETRSPANVQNEKKFSPLRTQLISISEIPHSCPRELRELLPVLSEERVKFPPCPEKLQQAYLEAKDLLRMDEKSTIEQLIATGCHSISREANQDSLESLFENEDPGRRTPGRQGGIERKAWGENENNKRRLLRESLVEVRNLNEPLDQWIRLNGEFAIPEEQLEFLNDLVVTRGCKLSGQAVDLSYRTIRSLEELVRIQPDSDEQRGRVEKFLHGIHTVIDRKIQEYFRP